MADPRKKPGMLAALTGRFMPGGSRRRELESDLERKIALATHAAAQLNRLTKDWKAKILSADAAVIPDLPTLHARARALVRDDSYAASAVRAFRRNVVGGGIRCAPQRQAGAALDDRWNRAAGDLWKHWSDSPRFVDIERRRNFAEVQRWVVDELVVVGEALVRLCARDHGPGLPKLSLQCIEAEQLDRDLTFHDGPDGVKREVRGGVEVDEFGTAVAYHIKAFTSPDLHRITMTAQRIDAKEILHIMEPGRARQTRATGRMTASIERLRNLGQYDFAQLVTARAEASIGLVIETPAAEVGFGGTDGDGTPKPDQLDLLPFMVARTAPGEKVQPFAPTRPGNGYRDFVAMQLKAVAAGIGISYEQIARDFTNGTYSSQRQAMLEDRREFRILQEMLITQLCQPVYDEFVRLSVIDGLLAVDAVEYAKGVSGYRRAVWMPDGWQWIDPEKETNADAAGLAAGLVTREELALERGRDWREIAQQRANEDAYIAQLKAQTPATPGVEAPQ